MDKLSLIPLGGIGDVTKNMYVYQYKDEILVVDCGLGFPDETMIGVDLVIPDSSYLLKNKHKIRAMLITHAHEDHFGALPFILPNLPAFPIFASPLTSAFANEKLLEFGIKTHKVKVVSFGETLNLGSFTINPVRVTHSVPDSANFIIKSPVGTFYHGSDFKFDQTPADGHPTEIEKIKKAGADGILCLLSDSLRIEKEGRTPSEKDIEENFEKELQNCTGKFIVTTYSSNVSRLNQAVRAGRKFGRRVCFVGRSLEKAKDIAIKNKFIPQLGSWEVVPQAVANYRDKDILLIIAGSQGQENSAMVRVANDEDKYIKIREGDVVVFSADPIPGNEVAINYLIDTLSRRGARVVYSAITDSVHVSGHGARDDIADMINFTKARFLIPIGGAYRHMVQFGLLARKLGYKKENVFLLQNGQEVIFEKDRAYLGQKIPYRDIYVDQITGGEIEGIVLRDRAKLARDGIVTIIVGINNETGEVLEIEFTNRGFLHQEKKSLFADLEKSIRKILGRHKGANKNSLFVRNLLSEHVEKLIFKKTRRRPLVLPIVVEL